MADKKISQLNAIFQVDSADLLAVVDVSGFETKKITAGDLLGSPTAIGNLNPNTGRFTSLQIGTGTVINEFSTDGTLSGNSDNAVPTEKAVKAYADSISIISAGDSSVHVIDSTASGTAGAIAFTVDGVIQGIFDSTGLTLFLGTNVNEFSIDGTLSGNSDDAVPTEQAVKTYVDALDARVQVCEAHVATIGNPHQTIAAQIPYDSTGNTSVNSILVGVTNVQDAIDALDNYISWNIRNISSDATAVLVGQACLVNSTSGDINLTLVEGFPGGMIIIKKISSDFNKINITTALGNGIDTEPLYVLDTPNKAITLLSNGSAFYII